MYNKRKGENLVTKSQENDGGDVFFAFILFGCVGGLIGYGIGGEGCRPVVLGFGIGLASCIAFLSFDEWFSKFINSRQVSTKQ